jgi:hypothetical protein
LLAEIDIMLFVPMAGVSIDAVNDILVIGFGYKINRLAQKVAGFIVYEFTWEVEDQFSIASAVLHIVVFKDAVVSLVIVFIFLLGAGVMIQLRQALVYQGFVYLQSITSFLKMDIKIAHTIFDTGVISSYYILRKI